MIQKQAPMVCRVGVAASTIIPPRAMMNVNCKVGKGGLMENETGVLEPEEKFERRYAVGIKVVATANNGVIPVRMFNPHSKPAEWYNGKE